MKDGKINVGILAVIIVVSLFGGAAVGFLVTKLTTPSAKTIEGTSQVSIQTQQTPAQQQPKTNEVVNETKQETNPVASVNYDGSKTIDINGTTYKVSYNSDIYEYDSDCPVVVNLYFNDKKVRGIDMPYQCGNIDNGETFNKEYSVELHNIKNEYIIVVIKSESKEFDYEYARLCVLNLNGEFIGSKSWSKGPESVNLKSNNKNLVRYEILEDGFLIFTRMEYATSYCDMIYTIRDNSIIFKTNTLYNADEIVTAGK